MVHILNLILGCMLLLSQASSRCFIPITQSCSAGTILHDSIAIEADLVKKLEYKQNFAWPVEHTSAFNPVYPAKYLIPDTSINNKLFLNNGTSIYKAFGIIDSLLRDVEYGFPEMYVKNRSGSQYLKMIQHLGCSWNSISEFEFGYTADLPDSLRFTASDMIVFYTENDIHLGMPQEEVIRIKGTGYKKTIINKKEVLISYVMKHWDESPFLRRYKMEVYYAHYICKKGKVTKVKFGFDYL